LVEDVEVSLSRTTSDDTRLLEKVGHDGTTRYETITLGEGDPNEFTETRRVVVLDGGGVTQGLEKGIGLQETIIEGSGGNLADLVGLTSNAGEVLDDTLGVLSLSGSGLSTVQD
jgi:hypothetical protein